jgi:SAM-dependent methyltransferase
MAPSAEELREFYDASYSVGGEAGLVYGDWRVLGARGKAGHALALLPPLEGEVKLLDVGCGDGALMAEVRARRPAWTFTGVDVAEASLRLAMQRNPEAEIRLYDGARLPFTGHEFTVGLLSHVLEHVPDPPALLRETARACRWIVLEVPLEANLSALRGSSRRASSEIGHLQRFSRRDVRHTIAAAGLRRHAELTDPLPREVHRFFAQGRLGLAKADAKWAVRTALHRLTARGAAHLFTLHYAALCGP